MRKLRQRGFKQPAQGPSEPMADQGFEPRHPVTIVCALNHRPNASHKMKSHVQNNYLVVTVSSPHNNLPITFIEV